MFENAKVNLIINKAEKIDTAKKNVQISDGREIPYDKLILAVGGSPVIPPIEGVDLEGVFTLRSLSDAEAMKAFIEKKKPKKMLFIGAGFITMEVAALLSTECPGRHEFTIVEFLSHPLPLMLDPEMAAKLNDYLVEKGFKMEMGQKVVKILEKDGAVCGVELDGGRTIDADMVFLNVGARANTELAEQAGLEMARFGVKVDDYLQTSDPDILAGGDCVEKKNFVTGKPVPGQLRGPAVIQGRLAAKTLAGYKIPFPGVLNNSAVKLFDKNVASTGFSEEQAAKEGIETVSATADSRSKHGMIPGMKPWTLKLVFDKKSAKLIGGQIISDDVAPVKEIDTVNALILGGKTIYDLTTLLCAGNPDVASEPSLEPITVAAEQALQKLK